MSIMQLVVNHYQNNLVSDDRTIKVMGKGDKEVVLPVGRMAVHFLEFHMANVWPQMNKFNRPEIFLSSRTGKPLGKSHSISSSEGTGSNLT